MKVTDIKTFLMHGVRRNWLFVKVLTDEGIHGWGEGTLELHEHAVEAAVHAIAPRVVGRDPTQIEKLWQAMYRHGFWRGGPVIGSAISAIDQALWDITGKAYDQPVYKLLGGAVRDRVRAYTHASDLRGARELVDDGFTAFKTGGWEVGRNSFSEEQGPAALRKKIASMRKELGQQIDIMVDNHGRDRASIAIKKIAAVEEFGLLFFEEATPPDNLDALAQVRSSGVKTDLATGERLYFRWGFKDLLERRLVDVIQPDICHGGGISELRRIAAHAETEYIKVAPHNPNGPVACAASVHLCAAIPNFLILETARDMPWHDRVQKQPLVIKDGYFELPTSPGLGIDLDEKVIRSRPFQPHKYVGSWDERDGGVADV
ncbi:MAG: galactonate dehydratase [Chloroflexi bacterium]|nr:galactonate dehydratase [Chloroflexota bacterium]